MVSKARTQMGLFTYRRQRQGLFGHMKNVDYQIRISEYFKQTADEIDDTLLHEMIHYLIAFRKQKDTSTHGVLFRREMARLNKAGRHITISVRTSTLTATNEHSHRQHLVLALERKDGRRYLTVVNPSYKNYIERLIALAPMISAHHWLISSDDYFNDFPQARSLRARRVTKEEYEHHLLHI